MMHHFPFRSISGLYRPGLYHLLQDHFCCIIRGSHNLLLEFRIDYCHRYSGPALSSEHFRRCLVPYPRRAPAVGVYPCIFRCPHPVSELPLIAGVDSLRPAALRPRFVGSASGSPRWFCGHIRVSVGPELVAMVSSAASGAETRLAQRWCFRRFFCFLLFCCQNSLISGFVNIISSVAKTVSVTLPFEVCFLLFLSMRFSSFSSIPIKYQIFFCCFLRCFAAFSSVFPLFSLPAVLLL